MGDEFPTETPTQWALEMRKWTILLWILLLLILIGDLIVLEVFACFSILCVLAIGYWVPWGRPPMQQIWIIFWGFVCAFNCIMDLILAILRYHRYKTGTYGRNRQYYGNGYNEGEVELTPMEKYKIKMAWYAVVLGFLLPLVELIVAWLCYRLYKDHQNSHDLEYGYNDNNYGSVQSQPSRSQGGGAPARTTPAGPQSEESRRRAAAAADRRAGIQGSGGQGSRGRDGDFQAFQGQGRRLDDRDNDDRR